MRRAGQRARLAGPCRRAETRPRQRGRCLSALRAGIARSREETSLKFGLIYELSVPRPFGNGAEHKVFHDALEQVQLADQVGFDQVWAVEHHFLEGYSHCSAPEIFLTACAMRTERIRVGHGIATCVPEINSAVKLAERAATLDIFSNGRVEFGTGRSGTWTELGGFGADIDSTKKTWDEYVRVIPRMWTEERFVYEGEAFSMPERAILPKPIQKPHPPLWVAVTSPGTELEAGERGLGCLCLSASGSVADQAEKIANYRHAIQHCDPVGAFVNEQVNILSFLYCHEDHEIAVRRGGQLAATFSQAAAQFLEIKECVPTNSYSRVGLLSGVRDDPLAPRPAKKGLPDGLVLGDPSAVIDVIRRWEATGADRLMFLLNAMDVIDQAAVLDSLRLFATEVMPKFAEEQALCS